MSCTGNYTALLKELEAIKSSGVKLLPVSKTVSAEVIKELYDAGVREFAENRIEALTPKSETLPKDICWHFIGRLQSNKVRKILKIAKVIHSVDSVELVQRIDRIAGEENCTPEIFLEISVSGEECKGGFPVERAVELAGAAAAASHIKTVGLMTMAPLEASPEECREVFNGLRECRDRIEKELGIKLPELSMGMSNDWKEAVECGSTVIRVGSSIFHKE
jgi:pyridoxal phosphate enzyme (YggS family)